MSVLLASDLSKVDPQEAWQPWVPNDRQPWDAKWAGHLERRAGFGASIKEIEHAVQAGFPSTLQTLLIGSPQAVQRLKMMEEIAETFANGEEIQSLRGWWLYAMLHGGHPLREKLALFWHNHFATSIRQGSTPVVDVSAESDSSAKML